MTDSMLSCADCGSETETKPAVPARCRVCDESDAKKILRRLCRECSGKGAILRQRYYRDKQLIEISQTCFGCGGIGLTT